MIYVSLSAVTYAKNQTIESFENRWFIKNLGSVLCERKKNEMTLDRIKCNFYVKLNLQLIYMNVMQIVQLKTWW